MNTTERTSPESPLQSGEKTKRERSTLSKVLPTDRIAFERQVEILRAYAVCSESSGGKPVSNAQAGSALKPAFSASTLGVAVPFFTDVGLISRSGSDFVPSAALLGYNQAVALSVLEAKRKLRPLFENTWFCRVLSPRLQLNPQPFEDCVGVLAIEAKAGPEHLPRVRPLINFLELAGIVSISGTTVTFVPANGEAPASSAQKLPPSVPETFSTEESHTLYLDKEKTKRVIITSPLFITQAEYERICKWIAVALIVENSDKEKP